MPFLEIKMLPRKFLRLVRNTVSVGVFSRIGFPLFSRVAVPFSLRRAEKAFRRLATTTVIFYLHLQRTVLGVWALARTLTFVRAKAQTPNYFRKNFLRTIKIIV
jgi:hypothetical protein